ncbi:oligosaccharide flippase family protein [Kluyvera ascorbata]|uniref:oligosaccharide flippase family protein n=1 Tax=Kluyvera ascorbata TaxID=51288 RepID=UPI0034D4922E
MDDKNKTLRDFVNYFIGDLFVKGFMFISLPLLSRIMGPEDYGRMSLINAAIMILYVFISLNLQNAILNSFMKQDVDFPRYLGTVVIGLTAVQFMLVIICILFSNHISELLSITTNDLHWVIAICVLLSYIYIYTSYLQGARISGEFVKINTISKISEVCLIFIIAYLIHEQKYLSKVISQLIISTILFFYVINKIKKIAVFKFDLKYFIAAIMFSAPLIIHVLSNSLLSQADRLIIAREMGASEAGIYSFSYNIGMGIIVVIMAWNSSWQPKLYRLLDSNKNTDISINIYKSSIAVAFLAIIAMLFSKEMVVVFAGKAYVEGITIVPIIIIGNALIHVYLCYVNFSFYMKKTLLISLGTVSAMLINIALNYYFIPLYGIAGAAWATVFSYVTLALFHYFIATFILKKNIISIVLLLGFLSLLLAAYIVVRYLNEMNVIKAFGIKIIIVICAVVTIYKYRRLCRIDDK